MVSLGKRLMDRLGADRDKAESAAPRLEPPAGPVLRCSRCGLALDNPAALFCPRCCHLLMGAGGCSRCSGCRACTTR
ncbi:MAG: hypothetical protein C4575_07610 [Desulforudis sp.]|nr:MAG: hypothetical protein C4575_07610 [Desulforudis sp.]